MVAFVSKVLLGMEREAKLDMLGEKEIVKEPHVCKTQWFEITSMISAWMMWMDEFYASCLTELCAEKQHAQS